MSNLVKISLIAMFAIIFVSGTSVAYAVDAVDAPTSDSTSVESESDSSEEVSDDSSSVDSDDSEIEKPKSDSTDVQTKSIVAGPSGDSTSVEGETDGKVSVVTGPSGDSTSVKGDSDDSSETPTGDSTNVEGENNSNPGTPSGDSTSVEGDSDDSSETPTGDSTTVEGDSVETDDSDDTETTSGGSGGGGTTSYAGSNSGEVLGAFASSEGTTCGMYLNEYMRMGMVNNPIEVLKLQIFLALRGYDVNITGFFGTQTDVAVKAFQSDFRSQILNPWAETLAPTGYVYKTTRYTINNILCPGSESYPELY